jgi:outer membrane protein TolC
VRQAERAMEIAFYNTQQARQNFYPDITITGTRGGGNDDELVNPSKLLAGAVASIVQPLFMQGKLRAQYKNRQIDQEKASLQFTQTLLNAGNEIYTHLHTCIKSEEQIKHYAIMINALQQAYDATLELMNNGTNTYLEVLKAQEDLLSGQLSEVENTNDEIQAFINLYTALGGF